MRTTIIILMTLLIQACSNSNFSDLKSNLDQEKLVKLSYEKMGNSYKCNPKLAQSELLDWSRSFKEPAIGSWADADEYLNLEFDSGNVYRIRVTLGLLSLEYSTLRMEKVYVGSQLNISLLCST